MEVGAFGKEAYILTGYFNLMKMLELALHDGFDPRTGKQIGARTGDPAGFTSFDDLFAAFEAQFRHVLDIKMRGNQIIERMYADRMPAHLPVGPHRRLHPAAARTTTPAARATTTPSSRRWASAA